MEALSDWRVNPMEFDKALTGILVAGCQEWRRGRDCIGAIAKFPKP